VVVCY